MCSSIDGAKGKIAKFCCVDQSITVVAADQEITYLLII